MLHALDFTHHLLGRRGNGTFHFPGTGTGQGHHDIRHGDINLRLLFLGSHHHGQNPQNNGQNSQKGRQVVVLEDTGNGTGRAYRGQFFTHAGLLPVRIGGSRQGQALAAHQDCRVGNHPFAGTDAGQHFQLTLVARASTDLP